MNRIDWFAIFLVNHLDRIIDEEKPDHSDSPPEYCHYRDEGCELAPSCLECPFPGCVEDHPWGREKAARLLRNREVNRLYFIEKKSLQELIDHFRLSRPTLYRILAAGRKMNERT